MWILLIILLPFAELALLIELGGRIGTLNVLALIILTGVAGVVLARRAGLGAARRMQAEVAAGRLPADAMFDAVLILLAGLGLLAPGVLTDIFGLLCLFPPTRGLVKAVIGRRLQRAARSGKMKVSVRVGGRIRVGGHARVARRERYGGKIRRVDEDDAGALPEGGEPPDSGDERP